MSAENTTETTSESTTLDALVRSAVEKVNTGSMTMGDLLKALSPTPETSPAPAEAPLPVAITDEQREALEKVVEVFGKVVPSTKRALEPAEVSQLVEEKETLDQLKKMAEARGESIRTTVFNHLDVEVEGGSDFDPDREVRESRGHWAIKGEVRGEPGTPKKFTREVRQNAPSLSEAALRALVEDEGVEFSHEDYLSMTTQTRVLDESKVMAALKKNPKLVHAIAKATRPGSKTASLYLRKS